MTRYDSRMILEHLNCIQPLPEISTAAFVVKSVLFWPIMFYITSSLRLLWYWEACSSWFPAVWEVKHCCWPVLSACTDEMSKQEEEAWLLAGVRPGKWTLTSQLRAKAVAILPLLWGSLQRWVWDADLGAHLQWISWMLWALKHLSF